MRVQIPAKAIVGILLGVFALAATFSFWRLGTSADMVSGTCLSSTRNQNGSRAITIWIKNDSSSMIRILQSYLLITNYGKPGEVTIGSVYILKPGQGTNLQITATREPREIWIPWQTCPTVFGVAKKYFPFISKFEDEKRLAVEIRPPYIGNDFHEMPDLKSREGKEDAKRNTR